MVFVDVQDRKREFNTDIVAGCGKRKQKSSTSIQMAEPQSIEFYEKKKDFENEKRPSTANVILKESR